MKTIVVVPCYNEEKRLKLDAFIEFHLQNPDYTFLFVNDGSKDNTLQVLQQASSRCPGMQYLDLTKNGGKAEAVRHGMLQAAEMEQAQFIAFYDADLATPLNDLKEMVRRMEMNDYYMIVGCRFRRLGGFIERTFFRFVSGRIFASFASAMLHLPVYDTQCGAKVFSKEIVKEIFNEPFVSGWIFDVELFARIIIQYGHETALQKLSEYPLSEWKDVSGSKVGRTEFIRQPISLLKIRKHYQLKKHIKSQKHNKNNQ